MENDTDPDKDLKMFAAAALTGLLNHSLISIETVRHISRGDSDVHKILAKAAMEIAIAMNKEFQ